MTHETNMQNTFHKMNLNTLIDFDRSFNQIFLGQYFGILVHGRDILFTIVSRSLFHF